MLQEKKSDKMSTMKKIGIIITKGLAKLLIIRPMRLAAFILSVPFFALLLIRQGDYPFIMLDQLILHYIRYFKGSIYMKRSIQSAWNIIKRLLTPFTGGITSLFEWLSGKKGKKQGKC